MRGFDSCGRRRIFIASHLLVIGALLPACGTAGHSDGPARKPNKSSVGALPAEIRAAGVLKVATDIPYPPFEMFADASQKKITGFDYDLGQAIGAQVGIRVVFIPQKFDGLIPGLQAGKYDAVMSAMTDDLERQRVVDFVDYFRDGTVAMVKKGNPSHIKTLIDLCGKTVGEQSGSQQVEFVKAQQPKCATEGRQPIKILQFPKVSDLLLAISSGRVDTFLEDSIAAAQTAAKNHHTYEVVVDPSAPGGYDTQPGGIAVLKGHSKLVHVLADALQHLVDNGKYTSLIEKYSLKLGAVSEVTINGGMK